MLPCPSLKPASPSLPSSAGLLPLSPIYTRLPAHSTARNSSSSSRRRSDLSPSLRYRCSAVSSEGDGASLSIGNGSEDVPSRSRSADVSVRSGLRNTFGGERELSGVHQVLQGLPATARYATCVAIVAGALAAGYALGTSYTKGKTRIAAIGGSVALGAAGIATAYLVNSSAPAIAAVKLHNAVAKLDDPTSLQREEVDAIVKRFGVSKHDELLSAELKDLYDRYVTDVIPSGNDDLKGDEVDRIIKFKNALGIEDPDAAAVHIEIGRRIFRQRLETGDKDTAVQERRAFQKLVYVSNLVFGEASKFYLPWKRVFRLTDSQVEIACRDNAQRLFKTELLTLGSEIDVEKFVSLRKAQLKLALSDEVASDLFRTYLREQLEERLLSAVETLKARTRAKDSRKVVEVLENVLAYTDSLAAVPTKVDPSSLPPGIGSVSIIGGIFDDERKMDELKQLYRAYLTEALSSGQLEKDEIASLAKLKNLFALGNREAEDITLDVTIKVYRKRLAQAAVVGGELDQASSKAAYLQNLCDSIHFDPEKAKEVHEDIYRQKLQQCLSDGDLSEDDVKALRRLHILLCLSKETVDAAHATLCGRIFEKSIDNAIAAGVDGYDADMKTAVQKSVKGLRLTKEAALAIAGKVVRAVFVTYVKRARGAGSRMETAKELRKLVAFNTLVVTELLTDIRAAFGEITEEKVEVPTVTEPEKVEEKDDDDEWQELQTLRKTRPKSDLDTSGKKVQTEITLKDDLELRERMDLYRLYLLFCISGESSGMPMGTQIVVKKDTNEFLRLGQLGSLLGLTSKEVADVHKGFAEQAFRQQAEVILADGQLSKGRVQQLNELQKQLGLPSEAAQKVISNIVNTKMRGAIETAVNAGRLDIKEVRELREAGVDIETMISADVRQQLFKKILDGIFSSGAGDFNDDDVYEKYPSDLGLDLDKAKTLVQDIAKQRLGNTLVQAVSLLRQKNKDGVVGSLNDLIACDKACPSEPLSWSIEDEVFDLFSLFYKSNPVPERLSRLQYLLGLSDATATRLQELVHSGKFSLEEENDDFEF